MRCFILSLFVLFVGTALPARADESCAARKASIVGKAVRQRMLCEADAIRDGLPHALCTERARRRLARRFAALDRKGQCDGVSDAVAIDREVDRIVEQLLAMVDPTCGDGVVAPSESCEEDDDAQCPGQCQADCTCSPVSCSFLGQLCFDLDSGFSAACCEGLVCPIGNPQPHQRSFCVEQECVLSPDCPDGSMCFEGRCLPVDPYGWCTQDEDCNAPSPGTCFGGRCAVLVLPPEPCTSSSDDCDFLCSSFGGSEPGFCLSGRDADRPTPECAPAADCAVPPPPNGGTCYLGAGSPGFCVPCIAPGICGRAD